MTMPSLLGLLTRYFIGITGLVIILANGHAHAQKLPEDVLAGIAARLDHARRALEKAGPRLGVAERRLLAMQLTEAEQALREYRTLARQGKWREAIGGSLIVVGSGLLADDASGAGVLDDVLLPFIGLGLLANHLARPKAVSPAELGAAWQRLTESLQVVAESATLIKAGYIPPPKALPGFPHAMRDPRPKTTIPGASGKLRARWQDPVNKWILEWDYQHGTVEKYTSKGQHLGEFDAETGEPIKEPEPGRKIDP